MNWLACIVPVVVVLLLIAATVLRRDLWPFSHYPMFAGYESPATMRFFRLQFTLRDGRNVALVALVPNLGDAFDREFAREWPDGTKGTAAPEIVRRFWNEAARFRPELRAATGAEVILRLAQIGRDGGVTITEARLASIARGDPTL